MTVCGFPATQVAIYGDLPFKERCQSHKTTPLRGFLSMSRLETLHRNCAGTTMVFECPNCTNLPILTIMKTRIGNVEKIVRKVPAYLTRFCRVDDR